MLMQTHSENSKSGRLEARISATQKRLFQRAAELQGSSLTDFVVSALQAAAVQVIREHEVMTLSKKDRDIFVSALLNPKIPNGRLKKAVIRYKKQMSS
jgi:uncharacterized protein (DUF1778 family)